MLCAAARPAFALKPAAKQLAVTGRRSLVVRAEADGKINPAIRKDEPKVVDTVLASEIDKQVVVCRCWRSGKFPYCDGAHMKHNQATGDNVGPMIIKKE